MLDTYVFGTINRISPEAPVPVVETLNVQNKLGGAANVALNLTSLGASVMLAGVLGNDDEGKQIEDWEPRKQLLFKSSEYGDEIDRPLQKSDGEWTYFANDIAYHYDKYLRGSTHLIDILGADHGGYIKRMSASIQALTNNKARFTAKLCQMVKLISDGKELKMSKRSGDFITLSDLVKEVGSDSIRFMMMYRKNEAPLEFDFKKVTEQSKIGRASCRERV